MEKRFLISKLWLFWVPAAAMVVQIGIETLLHWKTAGALHAENGPHEILQFVVITIAFFVAVYGAFQFFKASKKYLGLWFSLAAICCLYVAGEEISWGQHFLNWATPEFWMHVNDQSETNLHNTTSWLDQKPRLILAFGILVGGLVIPLLERFKPNKLPERFQPIYPPKDLFFIALLVFIPNFVHRIGEVFDLHLFARVSEVQELYMFYFVLLYLITIMKKEKAR